KTGTIVVSNHGAQVTCVPTSTSGNLSTRYDLQYSSTPSVREIRLVQGTRVVAAKGPGQIGTLSVHGRILGAGDVRLRLEVEYFEGFSAQSDVVEISVADQGGAPSGVAPVAASYRKHVLTTESAVVELPATFDDALDAASYAVLSPPAQATILGGGS